MLPIAQTTAIVGSGTAALQFSKEGQPFAAREKVTPATKALAGSQRLLLAGGTTPVALWNTYQDGLFESTRVPNIWTAPRQIVPLRVAAYVAAADDLGQVHVVAQVLDLSAYSDQFYLRRSASGEWTDPELLPNTPYGMPLALAVTPDGRVHLQGRDEFFSLLYYQVRGNAGWAPSEAVNPPGVAVEDSAFAVTPNGTATVAWVRRATDNLPIAILARTRQQNGTWSAVTNVHQDSAPAGMQLGELLPDPSGRLHLAWVQRYGEDSSLALLYYAQRTGAGWGEPIKISDSLPRAEIKDTVLSTAGEPRVAVKSGNDGSHSSVLLNRNPDGSWQAPQTVANVASPAIQMVVDPADRTYIAWVLGNQIGYRWRESSGDFSPIWWLGEDKPVWPPELALDSAGRTHLLYNSNAPNPGASVVESDVFYQASQAAATPGDAWVSQTVTVTEAAHPVLSFRYGYSGMTTSQSGFTAEVNGDAYHLAVTEGLTHGWLDLSAYRGLTVPVTFRLRQGTDDAAGWAVLDDVSLGSAHTDVWVEGPEAAAALPGQTVELVIQVGNRAGIIADSAKLELSLPPELAFVSAAPSPSGLAPLRWELGSLAAGEDAIIAVTVRVTAGAKPFGTAKATATLSADHELETLNNTAEMVVRVRREIYLPGVAAP